MTTPLRSRLGTDAAAATMYRAATVRERSFPLYVNCARIDIIGGPRSQQRLLTRSDIEERQVFHPDVLGSPPQRSQILRSGEEDGAAPGKPHGVVPAAGRRPSLCGEIQHEEIRLGRSAAGVLTKGSHQQRLAVRETTPRSRVPTLPNAAPGGMACPRKRTRSSSRL